jgi:DNA (cytosine-5)-methyltransferase 1
LQTNGKKVTKVIRGNGLNELALFAGAGGGILGGHLLGWRTVCAVEWESYPASVLLARQNDGILPPFPIWDDVQTFDGNAWRGIVDVVSGGFPCQDISIAGTGDGLDGERSGMWKEMARIIGEVRPQYAFIENSPMLTIRGLESVLADLAKMGFDAEWGVLSAADVGANHLRERIWIVAQRNMANSSGEGLQRHRDKRSIIKGKSQSKFSRSRIDYRSGTWWQSEPSIQRVVDGLAARVDRLKAIGNGQVPQVAATAWNILKGRLDERI